MPRSRPHRVLRLRKGAAALALAGAALAPAAAHAAWVKAETDRFVVFGDDDSGKVRDYAVKLTTYDAVLRFLNPAAAAHQPTQKVEVYLVRSREALYKVAPDVAPSTVGFYTAQPQGVFAVGLTTSGLDPDDVLFHEYAHHFMLENFPAAYPAWFVEGWAEYYMTTEIGPKGISIGRQNSNRLEWLYSVPWMPMEDVLSKHPSSLSGNDRALYYAQSWQLMHYMMDTPERRAALDKASLAIAAGETPVKAMEAATGMNLRELTRVLKRYAQKQVLTVTNFPVQPKVTLSSMPASADDVLLDALRLKISSVKRADPALLAEVRAAAVRYPGDRLAELTLAHAEFTFGDVAAGEAIARRRLAADPSDGEMQRLAGAGQILAGERNEKERVERFRAARPYFAKAFGIDPNDFRALYAYAYSRTVEPGYPTENDVNVLLRARRLAPAVMQTSMMAGEALLKRGERDAALRVLAAVANNPHGGPASARARALIAGRPAEPEKASLTDADEADKAGK